MVSLESDANISQRADFNKPYRCISIQNRTSTDYISDTYLEKPIIFWLDYTNPAQIENQISDFCTLVDKMNAGDVVRITLNANPRSLDGESSIMQKDDMIHETRFAKLQERIYDYIPPNTTKEYMISSKYPLLLLSCLKTAAFKTLTPLQKKCVLPLFASKYADGQQMITLTAIIVDNLEMEVEIKKCLKPLSYVNFDWNNPCSIQVPALTAKEIIHINNILPTEDQDPIKTIQDNFGFAFHDVDKPNQAISSYVSYYKYYPNFHHVNL